MRRHHERHQLHDELADEFEPEYHHRRRGPHGHGPGRSRARRGALGGAILVLLSERPMHGYELITLLEERSGGRWKPSPGAVYPALGKLEQRGFVTATEVDDKRQYALTEAGKAIADEMRQHGGPAPWDAEQVGSGGELRRSISELVGPARQIGRFGTPEQSAAAAAAIKEATAKLYKILADG